MRIMLATLCLNEMEWLPKLWEQHKNWPDVVAWAFVEVADPMYTKTNPTLVGTNGLSVDGTTDFLRSLSTVSQPVKPYVISGESGIFQDGPYSTWSVNQAQNKCIARQAYMNIAEEVRPDYVIVVDADEFYTMKDQSRIVKILNQGMAKTLTGFQLLNREIWRPASISKQPLLQYEVIGGYWNVRHVRLWKWEPGLRYSSNHNYLETHNGVSRHTRIKRLDKFTGYPEYVHLGFASDRTMRKAKNNYYITRGEGRLDGRQMYVDCRAAFETWHPGDKLPHGAKVIPYAGPMPEVLR